MEQLISQSKFAESPKPHIDLLFFLKTENVKLDGFNSKTTKPSYTQKYFKLCLLYLHLVFTSIYT